MAAAPYPACKQMLTRRPDKTRSGAIRHHRLIPTTFLAVQRPLSCGLHSPQRRVVGLLRSCLWQSYRQILR
ncbi:hydrogenase maturation protein [Salmonella enterica subsp. enterica serovar Typhimurium str. 14028S]|uniref:Hydrogenase maturation protein n=1 Tax=Salmonella typhimurium (strain 14028s / SGSC 2262) TaxID=588858 RepID=A0A0F6B5Q3_SALT1|nr:hydrogenase maturation protein [Salmonella enterica subsp. enterica serovar Typhimurium str. 14028S]